MRVAYTPRQGYALCVGEGQKALGLDQVYNFVGAFYELMNSHIEIYRCFVVQIPVTMCAIEYQVCIFCAKQLTELQC
jgi:hypothetical protein